MRNALIVGVLLACTVLAVVPIETGLAQKKPATKTAPAKKKTTPSATRKPAAAKKKAVAPKKRTVPSSRATRKAAPVSKKAPAAKTSKKSTSAKKLTPAKKSATTTSKRTTTAPAKTGASAPPVPKAIRLRQEELEKIRTDIREYEKRLASGKARERSTLERLDDMDRQTSLIRTLLANLNAQIEENERDIHKAKTAIEVAERELARLKAAYGRSIVSVYKRGRLHDTELLLSSRSLNLMIIRSRYLKSFTLRQRAQADEIRTQKDALTEQKIALESKLQAQQLRVGEKKREESVLAQRTAEHKVLLEQVRKDNAQALDLLRRRQAAANRIERLIADMVERDRQKQMAAAAARAKSSKGSKGAKGGTTAATAGARIADLPSVPISATVFGRLKGRLPWPVTSGAVVGGFGEQIHKRLGTVTVSNGIDIEVPPGTAVRSIADGTVSGISFIPVFGSLIIINHDDGFRTVYAHVTDIAVSMNQRVNAGAVIARSGEGVIGPQVHFELWRDRNKQNPLNWLAPR